MSGPDHFATMRATLVPQGTAPVVRIGGDSMYLDATFVQECISEAENVCRMVGFGLHVATPLERLAMHLLTQSAGIKR